MNRFILLTSLLLFGIAIEASEKKVISITLYESSLYKDTKFIEQDGEKVESQEFADKTGEYTLDTTTYTGIFNSAGDSVSIDGIDIFIQSISPSKYSVFFGNEYKLDVLCENGFVFVNGDCYTLSTESYNKFKEMRSVLAFSHLLIDASEDQCGKSPYPLHYLSLLNLNWGVDYYQCSLEKSVINFCTLAEGMIKNEAFYLYDKNDNFIELSNYYRSRTLISRDDKQEVFEVDIESNSTDNGGSGETYQITYNKLGGIIVEGYLYGYQHLDSWKTYYKKEYLPPVVL